MRTTEDAIAIDQADHAEVAAVVAVVAQHEVAAGRNRVGANDWYADSSRSRRSMMMWSIVPICFAEELVLRLVLDFERVDFVRASAPCTAPRRR